AMGRSQSTPGLVESRGRIPLEDMWVSPPTLSPTSRSSITRSFKSLPAHHVRTMESPLSATSSGQSSDDERRGSGAHAPCQHVPQSSARASRGGSTSRSYGSCAGDVHTATGWRLAHSPGNYCSMTQLEGVGTETTALMSHEALIAEIKRLRERLITLESENASMSIMLSQQQREVEERLAEIEMHICGASSGGSSTEDNERNRESII
ncbi:hypothetical protein L9F63_018442, partial [Diploptera punctata]